jgi:hypothetical protein
VVEQQPIPQHAVADVDEKQRLGPQADQAWTLTAPLKGIAQ